MLFQIFGKFVHPSFRVLLKDFPRRTEKKQEKLVKRGLTLVLLCQSQPGGFCPFLIAPDEEVRSSPFSFLVA
jgi:hypothetical protein